MYGTTVTLTSFFCAIKPYSTTVKSTSKWQSLSYLIWFVVLIKLDNAVKCASIKQLLYCPKKICHSVHNHNHITE